jgi:hypothetical protein
MDVFISWSGERSRVAAEALKDWLPMIINATKPFLSANDIQKGTRWASELALKLQSARAGIICLTPENIHSDWVLFETGALSKTLEQTYVCPFLIGLEPSDVKGPLAQFQATKSTKSEVLKLVKTLNSALGDSTLGSEHIEKAFEVWWPMLDAQLKALPPEESKAHPHRPDRELIEEILSLVRNQNRAPERILATDEQNIYWKPPEIGVIHTALTVALQPAGDKVTELGVVSLRNDRGRRLVEYLVNTTEGYTFQFAIPLPLSTDLVGTIREQLPHPLRYPEDSRLPKEE